MVCWASRMANLLVFGCQPSSTPDSVDTGSPFEEIPNAGLLPHWTAARVQGDRKHVDRRREGIPRLVDPPDRFLRELVHPKTRIGVNFRPITPEILSSPFLDRERHTAGKSEIAAESSQRGRSSVLGNLAGSGNSACRNRPATSRHPVAPSRYPSLATSRKRPEINVPEPDPHAQIETPSHPTISPRLGRIAFFFAMVVACTDTDTIRVRWLRKRKLKSSSLRPIAISSGEFDCPAMSVRQRSAPADHFARNHIAKSPRRRTASPFAGTQSRQFTRGGTTDA